MKCLIGAVSSVAIALVAGAADLSFIGGDAAYPTDWSIPANWIGGADGTTQVVPTVADVATIVGGREAEVGFAAQVGAFRIGTAAGVGKVTVRPGVTFTYGTNAAGGDDSQIGAVALTTDSGAWSELVINGGTVIEAGVDQTVNVGVEARGRLTVQNGGSFHSMDGTEIGFNAPGQVIVKAGGRYTVAERGLNDGWTASDVVLGRNNGQSSVTVTGAGSIFMAQNNFYLCNGAEVHVEDGGVLEVQRIRAGDGSGVLYVNGGTIRRFANPHVDGGNMFVSGLTAVYVGAAGMTIDVPAGEFSFLGSIRKDPALGGAPCGPIVKKGAGTLVFSSASSVDWANLTVEEGAVDVAFIESDTVRAADILALLPTEGDLVLDIADGATITVVDALVLGDRSLVKTGGGTLRLDGDNSWTGDTRIEGGVLAAAVGAGLPATSHVVFAGGAWAPLAETFTGTLGEGDNGNFTLDGEYGAINFVALDVPLAIDFGGEGADFALQHAAENGAATYFNYLAGNQPIVVENRLTMAKTWNIYANDGGAVTLKSGLDGAGDVFLRGNGTIELQGATHTVNSLKPAGDTKVVLNGGTFAQDAWEFAPQNNATVTFTNGVQVAANMFNPGLEGQSATLYLNGQDIVADRHSNDRNMSMTIGGRNNGGSATVYMTAGTLTTKTAEANIGYNNGTGKLYVSGGVYTAESILYVGNNNAGNGTLEVSGEGKVVTLAGFTIANNAASTGTVVIREGGVIEASSLTGGAGNSTLVFDGGTLKLTNTDVNYFEGIKSIIVTEKGGVIDTGNKTVSAKLENVVFTDGGQLLKKGAGTLTIDSIPLSNGLVVQEGTLRLASLGSAAEVLTAGMKIPPAPVAPAAPAAIPPPVLLHRYTFDNGDLADSVGTIALEHATGNPENYDYSAGDDQGASGNHYDVYCPGTNGDGGGTSLRLPAGSLPAEGSVTIEFWCYPIWYGQNTQSTLFAFGTADKQLRITKNSNDATPFVLYMPDGRQQALSSATEVKNTWSHFIIVLKKNVVGGATVTLCRYQKDKATGDEELLDEITLTDAEWTFDNTTEFRLNRRIDGQYGAPSVEYDDVRVWGGEMVAENRAKTAAAGYDSGVLPTLVVFEPTEADWAAYNEAYAAYEAENASFETLVANNYRAHRITFNGTLVDEVTGRNPVGVSGGTANADGKTYTFKGGGNPNNGEGEYINLGANYLPTRGDVVTLEAWFTPTKQNNWSKLFYFGNNNNNCILLTLCKNNDAGYQMSATVNGQNFDGSLPKWDAAGVTQYYLSVVINGNAATFTVRDAATGALLGTAAVNGYNLAWQDQGGLGTHPAQWNDPTPDVVWDEFRVWNAALSDELLRLSCLWGADNPLALGAPQKNILIGCGGTFETTGDVDLSDFNILLADDPEDVAAYVENKNGWTFFRTTDGVVTGLPQFGDLKPYGVKLVGKEGNAELRFGKRSGLTITIR